MKILAVKLADLGDLLTITPALRALRRGRPEAHITALVPPNSAPALAGSALVDDLITFPKQLFDQPWGTARPEALRALGALLQRLREERFEALALFHHLTTLWGTVKFRTLALASGATVRAGLDNGRGGFLTHRVLDEGFGSRHEVEYWGAVAALVGGEGALGPLEFPPSAEGERWAEEHLADGAAALSASSGPLVAIHPGSGEFSRARRWPIAGFTAVARSLQERQRARILLVGGASEAGLTGTIAANLADLALDLAGQTSVHQLGALLARCDLVIGNDGGVMHLATAVGTPVVAIFGPSNHRAWGPWTAGQSRAEVVRQGLACSPCFYVGHSLGLREGCPPRPCLTELPPEAVLLAAEKLLSGNEERSPAP